MAAVEQRLSPAREEMHRYLADGLLEIVLGAAMLVTAPFLSFSEVVMFWYLPWITFWMLLPDVKKRFVLPRGGATQPPAAMRSLLMIVLSGLALLGVVAFLGVSQATGRDAPWAAAVSAAIRWGVTHATLVAAGGLALLFGYLGLSGDSDRLLMLALWAAVTALVIDLSGLGSRLGLQLLLGLVGLPLVLSGWTTFQRFKAENPPLDFSD